MKNKSLLFALFSAIILTGTTYATTEFFVATPAQGGSDENDGTREKPFATLQKAKEVIQDIHVKNQIPPEGGVIVNILPGDYYVSSTLDLTVYDRGRVDRRIVYRSESKDNPARFIGGLKVTNFVKLTDESVLKRLPAEARGHVYEADLKALGLKNFGKLSSRGFARSTKAAHCELFYDGDPMTLAQWPNKGEFSHIKAIPGEGEGDGHGGKTGVWNEGYIFEGDRPNTWPESTDINPIWAHGYWAYDWSNSYEKVAGIDKDKKLIKLDAPNLFGGYRVGQRVYYLNILEELDQPGEYYADASSGKLYFWTPTGEAPNKETFVSELETPFVQLKQASFTTFENITFTACRGEGFTVNDCTGVMLVGCKFYNIGSNALTVSGGEGCMVIGCDFINTGDGGVSIGGGDRNTLKSCGHIVMDSIFQKQGRWSRCYVPAINMWGVGVKASHNLIYDHPHAGILFGGNNHTIDYNEIHHVALETGDVGAIYAGRDYTYRGNKVMFNYIHDTGGMGMGSMGIYNDDNLSGTYMYGNIFHKVQRAVFMGGGRDFVAENNVFVDCTPSIALDGRGLDKSPVWYDQVYVTLKDRLNSVPRDVYEKHYPEIYNVEKYLAQTNGVPPENIVVKHNISVGGEWKSVGWHATDDMVKWVDNFVNEDPHFVDAEHGNFMLKEDSPALKLGIKSLPQNQMGPRRSKPIQK